MDDNLKGYPDGGTGKSLLANSISKIRETAQEDGKNFDPTKSFAFQQVNADTKILFIDDLKQGFNFERVFPLISEGLQIEKKYQDRYTIPFEKSPKTNAARATPITTINNPECFLILPITAILLNVF